MKNIHLLPTPNPSKVYSYKGNLFLTTESHLHSPSMEYQNTYITNSEEIKEGDWRYDIELNRIEKGKETGTFKNWKKIILTTDADLIKDGVQPIEDDSLEWFVKNPNCESVETERLEDGQYVDRFADGSVIEGIYENYKIIIPKEEPKQKLPYWFETKEWKEFSKLADTHFGGKPKQETLEEVADRLYPYEVGYGVFDRNCEIDIERERFVEGVKYQQEQDKNKYSEEEVEDIFRKYRINFSIHKNIQISAKEFNEWFEQFKKK